MSDPDSQSNREAPAERVHDVRERNASATGRYQRGRSLFLAWLVGGIGVLMALGSAVNQLWWGALGGGVVVAGAICLVIADRHRVETTRVEDLPAHRAEMRWFLLGIVVAAAGLVLTVHPW